MGLTNSQSVNHKGNSLPVLAKNYALLALTDHSAPLRPRSVHLRNISRQRFEQWQALLCRLQRYNEYLWLPRECVWETECVCSSYGEVEIQYQDGIYTLRQEIDYRFQRQQYFQESELWYLLFLIITLQFNVSQNEKQELWNIHPDSIVITDQGHVKILIQLDRGQGEGEGEVKEFVPPQEIPLLLLKLIKNNDERVVMRINKNISETFQLGLTLLSAAHLINYQFLYTNSPLLTLDLDQLDRHLDQWRHEGRYTQVFAALVSNLCSFNPAHRLSGPQLWEWVTDHSAEIKSRSSFNFRYLPKKVSQLVAARIRDSQQGLLRNSRLKMEKLASSQVECRVTQMSPRSSIYEKHLYQPIHHLGKHDPPPIPRYRSNRN